MMTGLFCGKEAKFSQILSLKMKGELKNCVIDIIFKTINFTWNFQESTKNWTVRKGIF